MEGDWCAHVQLLYRKAVQLNKILPLCQCKPRYHHSNLTYLEVWRIKFPESEDNQLINDADLFFWDMYSQSIWMASGCRKHLFIFEIEKQQYSLFSKSIVVLGCHQKSHSLYPNLIKAYKAGHFIFLLSCEYKHILDAEILPAEMYFSF